MEDMKKSKEESVLMRHRLEKHNGEEKEFTMKVVSPFQHDPTSRQCAEAAWMRSIAPDKRINNKTEYHQPGDVEISYEKSINEKEKQRKLAKSVTATAITEKDTIVAVETQAK